METGATRKADKEALAGFSGIWGFSGFFRKKGFSGFSGKIPNESKTLLIT